MGLLQHQLWWNGQLAFTKLTLTQWPHQPKLEVTPIPTEEREISLFMFISE